MDNICEFGQFNGDFPVGERTSKIAEGFYDKYLYRKAIENILTFDNGEYKVIVLDQYEEGESYLKASGVIYLQKSKEIEVRGKKGILKYGVYFEIGSDNSFLEICPALEFSQGKSNLFPDDYWDEADVQEANNILRQLVVSAK